MRLVTSSLTDFAGDHEARLEFDTLRVQPLIAQDGFESATGEISAGEIVGGGEVPAKGSKSCTCEDGVKRRLLEQVGVDRCCG